MRLLAVTALTLFTLLSPMGAVQAGATAGIEGGTSFVVAAGDATSGLSSDRGVGSAEIRTAPSPSLLVTGGAAAGWDIEADRAYLATSRGGAEVAIPALGQTVFLHTDWYVSGSGSPGTYFIRGVLDGTPFCTGSAALEFGSFTIWCNDGWRATSGSHTLRWELDYTGVVSETDETNNSASRRWTTGSLLDIEALDAFLRTAPNGGDEVRNPALGQAVFVHLRLRVSEFNGDLTVPLRALLDDTVFCSGDVAVNPGNTVLWCNDSWIATEGRHTLQWVLDSDDVIAETDETNNTVSTQWRTSADETPEPTDTEPPVLTATATPTPTRAVESPAPTPTEAVLAYEGFFARGDGNCSVTLTASDVVAHVRGLGGDSVCDNDDCDRDGSVTAADVDCGARCLFGECPVPLHGPRVTGVTGESAPSIVPFSVIRITGTNFGPEERLKGVTIGGVAAEVAEFISPDTLLAIVPGVEPGQVELVVLDGDLAGLPFPVTIAEPQPIAPPDTFADFVELLKTLLERFEALDLEAFYGERADFIRGQLFEARRRLLFGLIELLSDPSFTEEMGTELDAMIDSSGVPELLRSTISDLEALGEGGELNGSGAVGGTTVLAVAGVTKVAGATAGAAGTALTAPVLIAIGLGVAAVGGVIAWAAADTPVITAVRPDIPEAGGRVEVEGQGFGSVPPLPKLLITTQQGGPWEVTAERSDPGFLTFRVPHAVGLCGRAEFALTRLFKSSNTWPVRVRPVLLDLSAYFVVPNERLKMYVRGVAGCTADMRALYRQDEGEGLTRNTLLATVENGADLVETDVPLFVPGRYLIALDTGSLGLRSPAEKQLTIETALTGLQIECGGTEVAIGGGQTICVVRGIPRNVDLPLYGQHEYQWTVSGDGKLEMERRGASTVLLTGSRPGTVLLEVVLRRTDVDPGRLIAASSESHQLTVTEKNAPTITLQRDTPEIVEPGTTIQVTAKAEDDFEMQKIILEAEGEAVRFRRQEYECPLFGLPGASRKCEQIFQIQLKEKGFEPGPITVSATAIDGSDNAGASNELLFRFELGDVTGTVRDASTGDPIQGVNVELLDDSGEVFDQVVAGGGGFGFFDVPVGTYTVRATASGFLPGQENAVVEADTETVVEVLLTSEGPGLEVNLLEYRRFDSDTSLFPGDPGFNPDDSPIRFDGSDASHPILTWDPPEPARRITVKTEAGRETYYVSGDILPPVRVGDCVGECVDCAPDCDTFRCYCGGNTHMPWCIGNVRILLVDGRDAIVRVCLSRAQP